MYLVRVFSTPGIAYARECPPRACTEHRGKDMAPFECAITAPCNQVPWSHKNSTARRPEIYYYDSNKMYHRYMIRTISRRQVYRHAQQQQQQQQQRSVWHTSISQTPLTPFYPSLPPLFYSSIVQLSFPYNTLPLLPVCVSAASPRMCRTLVSFHVGDFFRFLKNLAFFVIFSCFRRI